MPVSKEYVSTQKDDFIKAGSIYKESILKKVFIIAEAGVNHNGSVELSKKT